MRATAFLRRREGNVALMFALSAPLVLGFAGVALDFARYREFQARLQEAADASALVGAREYLVGRNRDDIARSVAQLRAGQLLDGSKDSSAAEIAVAAGTEKGSGGGGSAGGQTLSGMRMSGATTTSASGGGKDPSGGARKSPSPSKRRFARALSFRFSSRRRGRRRMQSLPSITRRMCASCLSTSGARSVSS